MHRSLILSTLILPLIFFFSCTGNKVANDEPSGFKSEDLLKSDSLIFTSGIRSIFQDSKGVFWFGSLQEGIASYAEGSFTYYSRAQGMDTQIYSVKEDKNGVIWFDTQSGVCSFDGSSINNHRIRHDDLLSNRWMKTPADLWFAAGNEQGVYRYDGALLTYLAFPKTKVVNPFNIYAVTDISEGAGGMTWFATYAGVLGYDGYDFTIINDETLGLDIEKEPLHVRSILEDSKGRLWIGNNGIGLLLKEGDSIINFSEEKNLIHPNSKRRGDQSQPGTLEHVFTIAEDSAGNIWFGDRDAGIWKYDGKSIENFTVKDGLTNDFATSIYEDQRGDLWFGMADGSVYKFNGSSFERQFD